MNPEEIHLRDYLKVINKYRALIIVFMLVTFAVVALGTFSATPQYLGSTKVMIEKAASSNLTNRYNYNYYDPEFYETQSQLIKSQEVAKRVVDLLSLETTYDTYMGRAEKPSNFQSVKEWISQIKGDILSTFQSKQVTEDEGVAIPERSRAEIIAESISTGITVTPIKESRIVSIQFASPNPEFAALIANTTTKAYVETTLDMKMESTRRTLAWMTKKAEQERLKLDKTEQKIQAYMRSNELVTLENRITVLPQKLSEISTQLVRAQNKREKIEALYRKVKRVAKDPVAAESVLGMTHGNTLQILRDQILKAEQHIRELSSKFGAKHPTMIKAKGDLDILRQKKAGEVGRLIGAVKNEFELAVSDENNLRKQLNDSKIEAQNLNEKFIQYSVYKREMDTNRQMYDSLLLKMKEQSITGETQPINLWIVERASIPLKPFKPKTKVNLLLGLIVGLFGGVGLAFFVEYLDKSIKYPEETEKALGVPVLGMIPLYKEKKGNIDTLMLDQPRSAIAESFRALRTSVMLSSSGQPPRKILVTSGGPGAGKSTTSINLAMAIAQSGKKVLLIDADLRKPRLHKIFGIEPEDGLSSYLAGWTKSATLIHTTVENLALLPAGTIPPNPSELLGSEGMRELIDNMSEHVDFIICDSPPLQPVVDARILSQLFDGTVLVVKGKHTTYELARRSLKQLQDANAPIIGVLINALELKKNDYYYKNYYGAYGDDPTES